MFDVSKFIKELDSNYGRLNSSTDFEFYVDENVLISDSNPNANYTSDVWNNSYIINIIS